MSGRGKRLSLLALALAVCSLLSACGGGQAGREDVEAYLGRAYSGKYQVLDGRTEGKAQVFRCRTENEYAVDFEVRTWVGGTSTPWGELAFLPERKYTDTLAEQIDRLAAGGTATGESLAAVAEEIRKRWEAAGEIYHACGLDWKRPSLMVKVSWKGRQGTVSYSGQADSLLMDELTRQLVTGEEGAYG